MFLLRRKPPPTIFHVTHWKAGSQWIRRVLQEVQPHRIVAPKVGERQFFIDELVAGKIYPAVYITREQFAHRAPPENSRALVVLRDLRDTLVSAYFSARYSHALMSSALGDIRTTLNSMTEEDGLIMLAEKWLPACAAIHSSWLHSQHPVLWYEDLLKNDVDLLGTALLRECELNIPAASLQEAIVANRFANVSGGRAPGTENVHSHERKAVAGDWKNHFTSKVTARFETLYGNLLAKRLPSRANPRLATTVEDTHLLSESDILAAYDRLAPLFPNVPSYLAWLSWEYAGYRKLRASGRVLDYGCLDGRLAGLILEGAAELVGLASDATTADIARLYGPYDRVAVGTEMQSLPTDAKFDRIFARVALARAADPVSQLAAFRDRLAADGDIVCTVLTNRFRNGLGLSRLLSVAGFSAAADIAQERYTTVHEIKQAKSMQDWNAVAAAAGLRIEAAMPIIPDATLHLFSLLDSLWHTPREEHAKFGDLIQARLSCAPSFVEGLRSVVSGLATIDRDTRGYAGAVIRLVRKK